MYNIAITKENKTEFFYCTGDKPRQYPTLADALVSAQYLGLSQGDVELHFVKEGTSIERLTQASAPGKKAGKGKQGVEANPGDGGSKDSPDPDAAGELALKKKSKEELLEYAAREKITVNAEGTQEEIIAAIQSVNKPEDGGEGNTDDSNAGGASQA